VNSATPTSVKKEDKSGRMKGKGGGGEGRGALLMHLRGMAVKDMYLSRTSGGNGGVNDGRKSSEKIQRHSTSINHPERAKTCPGEKRRLRKEIK